MDWLIEPFEPIFMQRALLAGIIAVVASSVIGTWVVLRGLAFLGDALAHGIIPGVALAVLVGFSPVLGALGAAVIMSLAVTVVSNRTQVREDTSIGLLFVGMLALGVIIISKSASSATSATDLLFGDVLGVTAGDLRAEAIMACGVVLVALVLHRPFLALTFNRDKASTLGMRPALAHLAMLMLLALAIVASFQTIGALLVFGLLIGPPATASLLVRRVHSIMAVAMVIGVVCVIAGLVMSFHLGTAGGATVAALCVAAFFVTLAGKELATVIVEVKPVSQ